jgi:protein-tyrosine-phosphatase
MAEGFARTYGSDILSASSAGVAPAAIVAPLTYRTMQEWNIALDGQFPKSLDTFPEGERFDVLINMSGYPLPLTHSAQVETWEVRDPIGESPEIYRQVAKQIEGLVMHLILRLRAERTKQMELAREQRRARRRLGRALGPA